MIIIKNFNDNQNNKSKFNENEFKNNIKNIEIADSKGKMINYGETSMSDSTKDLRQQEKQQIQKYEQNKLNFSNKNEQDKFNIESNNNKNDEQNKMNNENNQNSYSNKNDQNFNNVNKDKDKDKNKDKNKNNNNNNIK